MKMPDTKDNAGRIEEGAALKPRFGSLQPKDFIRAIVCADLEANKNNGRVMTRFPPEPNGYLHIGHAKSICLNFGIAAEVEGGKCNLRFDDTNPAKEDVEYVEAIKADVRWLGFDWENRLYYASDYFDQLYRYAVELIKMEKAYVCSLSADEIREYRGTLTEPGRESPYRNRPIVENLELLEGMKAGKFEEGAHVLRAKIDMASPNLNMRDPVIYRIRKAAHHRTGARWCIYPMYDFAHALSDSIEGITHSICTLEFEDHRPLYDWFLDRLNVPCHPQQIEFARLNLSYTVMSKRKLLELVKEGRVKGWDDPRMPTLVGLRRRGYTPASLRLMAERSGVSKAGGWIDYSSLDIALRDDLEGKAPRAMAVLDPLKLVLTNWDTVMGQGVIDTCSAPLHPAQPERGKRSFGIGREIWIERDDFMEEPSKGYHRLYPGNRVRLKYAHVIQCIGCTKDASGNITEVQAELVPDTKSGTP